MNQITTLGRFAFALLFFACLAIAEDRTDFKASTTQISPGPEAQFEFQSALINAIPGDVIEFAAGEYQFRSEINVVCDNITIRGRGPSKTVLSFKGQHVGSNGIVATGNAFVIEDLAVEDTAGNAIKVLGATDVTFRNVRVEWTDGPNSENGAYGIYPVECRNVLIDGCSSFAASDAGIYVGQSQDVIVKNCVARQNVAGIEVENTLRADVFNNTATDNAAGLLVFDLPGLNLTNGGDVRLFDNVVTDNNHENFAPPGTMVSDVPSGSGIMLMATDRVEIFRNKSTGNQTANMIVVSFLATQRKLKDKNYDPYPEAFSIHDNQFSGGGTKPGGALGALLSPVIGTPFPDIFYDGITDDAKLVNGKLPAKFKSDIRNNGEATFCNVKLADLSPANIFSGKFLPVRDIKSISADMTPVPEAVLKPHGKPDANGNPAVAVYRKAPRLLSEWKLLSVNDGVLTPAADTLPYELNTPLFSDHTTKYRAVRLPAGAHMNYTPESVLDFPVGTVIAKTFAYPAGDATTAAERFVETRVELKNADGWYGYSYIWNDEQTDAKLALGGGEVEVSWLDPAGEKQSNLYQVPNANQCISCHANNDKFVPLGPTVRNLNRELNGHNQLAHWIQTKKLKDAPEQTTWPQLAAFHNEKWPLDQRARAWLEVNCAHCHNPQGSARTSGLDLRTVQAEPARYGVFKSPVATGKGSGGRRYDIVPGKPEESILLYRLETSDPGARMPNLARNMPHDESIALIRQWIAQMEPAKEE